MTLQERFYDLTHGWHALVSLYVLVAVFSLAGLIRGRARLGAYFTWPVTTLPTLVITGLSAQVLNWALETFADIHLQPVPSTLFVVVVCMGGGMLGGLYWARRGAPIAAVQGRGAVVFDGAEVQKASQKVRAKALKRAPEALPLSVAGVTVPSEDEVKHFKAMGTTGSGKSTALRELLHAALYRGDRAVIADPDGGYLSRFYDPRRGDVILNPFDGRSAKWNLFAEIRNAYDVDQLARAFIPDRGGSDPQWTSYARTFFSAVTRQAQSVGVTDVGELYRLLTAAPKEEIKILVEGTPAAPFVEDGIEKMFGGIRSTTADAVKCLDYIREGKGAALSVREWVRTGKGVMFLPYQADQIAALKAVISTWMRLAIFQTLSLGEGDHRLWFLVDELDALGAIDGLPDALARLRKFGGRCALGFQSVGMITTLYGTGPAQAMVENCGNSLVLRCSASDGGGTARFASRLIGEREVTRTTRSISRPAGSLFASGQETESQSEHHATESAVMPAEIEQLPDRAGFLKLASQPAWMRVGFPIYELPKVAEPFVAVGDHRR